MGGKHRQAKEIADVVARLMVDRDRYVEPFIGGGAVFGEVAPLFTTAIGGDTVASLIDLWREVVHRRWEPPQHMDKAEYMRLKHADPSALKAWAGYAGSYNGKWFGGYAAKAGNRNYLAESARRLDKRIARITDHPGVAFRCCDYTDHVVNADTVVYCDPPYAGTTGYGAAAEFDHERFWRQAEEWSRLGALVLVHEYTAPEGWEVVHSRARTETMNHYSSGGREECLFVFEGVQ